MTVARNLDPAPAETAKTAELQLMLALKKYVDAIVTDSLKRRGIDAVVPAAPPRAATPTRWVYFIQGEDGGPIKIGVANDPEKRLSDLQRTSPVKLLIVARRPGELHNEKSLHLRFAEHRLHGEWFEPCDELIAEVERCAEEAAA